MALVLIAAGLGLMAYGVQASESFSSDVSRFFTGSPTDRTLWLMVGGFAAVAAGIGLAALGKKPS
jgi:hypothetical protein